MAIDGGYDFLDGVIFVNSCDAMRRLHDVWKRYVPTKFIHILDIPMGNLTLGANYLKEEFIKLKVALEKHASIVIKDEDIRNAIEVFNESRLIYNQLNSLRIENPPLISGTELMNLTSNFFTNDPKVWNDKTQSAPKELELLPGILAKMKTQSQNGAINTNPRILLSGSPLHEIDFISFMEEIGLNVVYEDLCTGSKFFDLVIKNSPDLLASLSEAYLNRTPCARMMQIDERVDQICKMAEKFKADGIIHHSLKFCDTYLYDVPALKKFLNEKGLSVLFIESDGGLGDINQIRTRIEAFLEIIKSYKKLKKGEKNSS